MENKSKLGIFVFSYNRAVFLRNCLDSIRTCAPRDTRITVIDDSSTDFETLLFLKEIPARYGANVLTNNSEAREFKTGGLCGGMNIAIREAEYLGLKYAVFAQDDMQLLRPITKGDLINFDNYFLKNHKSFQLSICFFPLDGHFDRYREMELDPSGVAWRRIPAFEKGKTFFSDVGVFFVDRFISELEYFDVGEEVNARRCEEAGLFRGLYRAPLMHWLPFPKSFRNGARVNTHAMIEKICGAGFHPYLMRSCEDDEPKMRDWFDPQVIAEYALVSPTAPKSPYLTGAGGVEQIFARRGWRLFIFRLLQVLRGRNW